MNYDFTWLWDSVGNEWHIYGSLSPQIGDTALDTSHVCSASDLPSGDNSAVPNKCATCMTNARNQGYAV